MNGGEIQIGMIGCGVVGQGVVDLLANHRETIHHRIGAPLAIKHIAVKNPRKTRNGISPSQLSNDPQKVLTDPDIDIVVEVMGGIDPARGFVQSAIQQHKHVVTANKALIAEHGHELVASAQEQDVDLMFEAAVCGGIPILRMIRENLASDEFESIRGIVNGTSNYILTQMESQGWDFDRALKDAQKRGYAEADPALDVNGGDANHKLTILSTLAYKTLVSTDQIPTEGIEDITLEDIELGHRMGYHIKLLACADRGASGALSLRVQPTMIPLNHPLAEVPGVLNAVQIQGAVTGPIFISGEGAGGAPTASSIVSDIIDTSRSLLRGKPRRVAPWSVDQEHLNAVRIQGLENHHSKYFLRMHVEDKPGILAQIAQALGHYEVSIEQLYQRENAQAGNITVIIITRACRERQLQSALVQIEKLEGMGDAPKRLPIEPSPE